MILFNVSEFSLSLLAISIFETPLRFLLNLLYSFIILSYSDKSLFFSRISTNFFILFSISSLSTFFVDSYRLMAYCFGVIFIMLYCHLRGGGDPESLAKYYFRIKLLYLSQNIIRNFFLLFFI